MHGKTLTKLMLDIVLTAMFIVLIYPRQTGFTFHEIAGLSVGALFVFHIMLNWAWVKNVTKNLFNTRMKTKPRLFYLLNCLSLIGLATIATTGVQISQVVFPAQGSVSQTLVMVHKWAAYSCLGLLGLHLALHWRFFVHTVPRMFRAPGRPSFGRVAANLGAFALILALLYSQLTACTSNQPAVPQESQVSKDARPRSGHHGAPPSSSSSSTAVTPANPPASSGSGNKESSSSSGQSGSGSNDTGQSSTESSISKSSSKSSTSVSSGTNSSPTGSQVTLAQYLGSLFCNGCDKHCSLLSPQCNRGTQQQEAAKQKYQTLYASASKN